MEDQQVWIFSDREKQLIRSIATKGRAEDQNNKAFAVIDLESFYRLFTNEENAVMQKMASY